MKVYDSRTRIIGPSRTVHRSKKCLSCGARYQTAEVPFSVAKEVWEEE
jgi:transcriptional regulator NrdR family protein